MDETVAPASRPVVARASSPAHEDLHDTLFPFRARLHSLVKNSFYAGFVSGHDFSRAEKANKMNRALAPAGRFSRLPGLETAFLTKPFSRAEESQKGSVGFSPCCAAGGPDLTPCIIKLRAPPVPSPPRQRYRGHPPALITRLSVRALIGISQVKLYRAPVRLAVHRTILTCVLPLLILRATSVVRHEYP